MASNQDSMTPTTTDRTSRTICDKCAEKFHLKELVKHCDLRTMILPGHPCNCDFCGEPNGGSSIEIYANGPTIVTGQVLPKDTVMGVNMFGKARRGDAGYVFGTTPDRNKLFIQSMQSKRVYLLGWNEVTQLAINAGVDNDA